MEIRGLGFIPLFLAIWCVAWLSTSYTLTIIYGHATPLMYISEAGCFYPEYITFNIGFLGMSIATLVLTFMNYKFILFYHEAFGARQALIQKILLALAWSSCVGTAVMALFSTEQFPITHRVSAFIAFVFSCIYNLWQSILLYKVPGSRRAICHLRTVPCAMALTCVLIFIGSRVSVYTKLCDGDCEKVSGITAMIIEWSLLVLILVNILTYFKNMQSLSMTVSRKGIIVSRREQNQDFGV